MPAPPADQKNSTVDQRERSTDKCAQKNRSTKNRRLNDMRRKVDNQRVNSRIVREIAGHILQLNLPIGDRQPSIDSKQDEDDKPNENGHAGGQPVRTTGIFCVTAVTMCYEQESFPKRL